MSELKNLYVAEGSIKLVIYAENKNHAESRFRLLLREHIVKYAGGGSLFIPLHIATVESHELTIRQATTEDIRPPRWSRTGEEENEERSS